MNAHSSIDAALVPAVYGKIAAVQASLAKTGIAKSRRNQQQGYQFRGIDEVYDALAPLLAENGLCILPRVLSREVVERTTAKGGAIFNVTVEVEFDFVSADDGSIHVIKTFGEAMDSADKATNKAMSAAYKYAALMAFAIPTEGDNDADAITHEVAPRNARQQQNQAVDDAINAAQLSKLRIMLESLGLTEDKWLRQFGAPKDAQLHQLPEASFRAAVGDLEDRMAQAARQQSNGAAQNGSNFAIDDEVKF